MKKFLTLHFFDVLVGVAIILTIATMIWFRQSRKTEWITVAVRITNTEWWWPGADPNQWYTAGLKVGDQAINTFGQPIAEITKLDLADVGAAKQRVTVHLKLQVKYDPLKKLYLFNFQPLQVGRPIELGFGKHNLAGIVSAVNTADAPTAYRTVELKLIKVRPWEAEELKVGLRELDQNGEVVTEILDVRTTPNLTRVFSDIRGEMVQVANADYRDVTFTARLKSHQIDSVWYFVDGAQLKVGDEMWLHFPTTTVKSAQISRLID